MMYTEIELKKDLEAAQSRGDMNVIREKLRRSSVSWSTISPETKLLYKETQERVHPCPKEISGNPDIHFELPNFCRPTNDRN